MKRFIIILVIAIITFSCQEDQTPFSQFPETWKLAGWRSYGFLGDSGFQPISDSTYTYLFKKNGTFLKTVGKESTAGTFQTEVLIFEIGGKRTQYNLIFPDDKLIDSCFGISEKLYINENKMLVGETAPCDGPTLFFSLAK